MKFKRLTIVFMLLVSHIAAIAQSYPQVILSGDYPDGIERWR